MLNKLKGLQKYLLREHFLKGRFLSGGDSLIKHTFGLIKRFIASDYTSSTLLKCLKILQLGLNFFEYDGVNNKLLLWAITILK